MNLMQRHQRILIISDTHGTLDPRIAALARDCDWVVHAGDVGNTTVLAALAPRREVVAVRGNNDVPAKWPTEERSTLQGLPDEAALELPGGRLVVLHGHRLNPASQRHQRLRLRYPGARAVVVGHSHRLEVDRSAGPWILNPGAAGRARTFGGPSCLLLELDGREWRVEPHRFAMG